MIDIIEQEIAEMSEELFDILLKDRTTKKYLLGYGSLYFLW